MRRTTFATRRTIAFGGSRGDAVTIRLATLDRTTLAAAIAATTPTTWLARALGGGIFGGARYHAGRARRHRDGHCDFSGRDLALDGSDRGLALTDEGGELVVLPTYTAMLTLRGVLADRGLVAEFWEKAPA